MINPKAIAKTSVHPKPICQLTVDGADITTTIQGRLIDLTLTDNRGFEADQLDLRLDDTDGLLDLPPRGAEIRVALGWQASGLVDKGIYTVDEVEHSGTPDTLTIRARSADLRAGLTTQRERSWHDLPLGDIITTLADENDLEPLIQATLAGQYIEHIDQTNESAVNLLTRLATQFDAISTVKNGKLLFIPAAGGVSASGIALPAASITRESGDQHRFSIADRETYTGVKATYHDTDAAVKGEVTWGKDENASESPDTSTIEPPIAASAESIKTLRHVYANKTNALRAARAEWRKIQRGMANFSITLARARPELFPDIPVTVSGWKPAIDSTDWILTKVTHTLSDSGFTSALELEIKATEVQD